MATSDFRGLPRRFASKIAMATQDTPLPHPHTSQTVQKRAGNEILEPGKRFGPIRISIQNPGFSMIFGSPFILTSLCTASIISGHIGFSWITSPLCIKNSYGNTGYTPSPPPHVSNCPETCRKRNIGTGEAIRSDTDFESKSWMLEDFQKCRCILEY